METNKQNQVLDQVIEMATSKLPTDEVQQLTTILNQLRDVTATPDEIMMLYRQACKALGIDPDENLPFSNPTTDRQHAHNAIEMLWVLAEHWCKDWKPDWTNSDQWKYYPWFDMSSGSGVSYGGYVHDYSNSIVGSRLCFPTSDMAKEFGQKFTPLYEKIMIKK
ncbi:MAG: hypothetical protein WC760_02830 [Bacteroidia bacterium]|jgi:hypothetical protein